METIKRGDVFYADLGDAVGSEQGGIRPVVVVQNDIGNKYSPTIIVVPITSKNKKYLPTHVRIQRGRRSGLPVDSTVLLEQITVIDKRRIKDKTGTLDKSDLSKVMEAMKVSLALN